MHHANDGNRLPTLGLTAVTVDKDKNSPQTVKWALDHLLINTATVVLIHVRNRPPLNQGDNSSDIEAEMQQFFLPYRGFCARKGLQMKEVVLEDNEVAKAIIEYINANSIQNIVVAASNRNAITRKFRNPDVATCLLKGVPEFCAVYVISKGKPVSVRSAKSPAPVSAVPPRQSLVPVNSQHLPDPDVSLRTSTRGSWRGVAPPSPLHERRSFEQPEYMKTPSRDRPFSRTGHNMSVDNLDNSVRTRRSSADSRDSFSDDLDFHGSTGSMGGSMDFGDSLEFSGSNDSPKASHSPISSSQRDVEAEMRRLRLELKQTMDMYNNAF